MASKVLVPAAPFAKLQVKKPVPDVGSGFIIGGDPAARVAHLEHSVRFLQEQHRLMLSGLHAEIEALRERNRDLQFQLIFNKESTPKTTSPPIVEDSENNEEANLKREVSRLEREAAAARGEARAAEARALQLQRLVDAQAEKLRALDVRACSCADAGPESRGELRARLGSAERLVRRLRADAERQRREVPLAPAPAPAPPAPAPAAPGGAVTNLLFDGAAARHAHLQCMKNSLHASLRASGLDGAYGYQNNYHFPPLHTADFWREPVREELVVTGAAARGRARRPLTLPDLTHQLHRSTVYANNHTRSRANGYENKHKKVPQTNGEVPAPKTPEDTQGCRLQSIRSDLPTIGGRLRPSGAIYPELKVVVTKLIPRGYVSTGEAGGEACGGRGRARRVTHRKHAPDHT